MGVSNIKVAHTLFAALDLNEDDHLQLEEALSIIEPYFRAQQERVTKQVRRVFALTKPRHPNRTGVGTTCRSHHSLSLSTSVSSRSVVSAGSGSDSRLFPGLRASGRDFAKALGSSADRIWYLWLGNGTEAAVPCDDTDIVFSPLKHREAAGDAVLPRIVITLSRCPGRDVTGL